MSASQANGGEILHGGCRCGAVRYTIALDAWPRSYACHCHQCQRWSGSAFSQQIVVPERALTVSGPLAPYALTTLERTSHQRACATCHSRIFNTNTRHPGVAVVRAGTLDRSTELVCVIHIYVAYKQPWVILADGVPTYPESAPAEAMIAALHG